MNIKSMPTVSGSRVKLPFEKIHHFVATPSLSAAKTLKSPTSEKPKLKPLQTPVSESEMSYKNIGLVDYEVEFENFMILSFNTSYPSAIEELFKTRWNADDVILWENSDALGGIFSISHGFYIENYECLAGHCFTQGATINTECPSQHGGYSQRNDSKILCIDSPNLIFTLTNYKRQRQFVVQVVMPPGADSFSKEDLNFVSFFQRKFAIFSRFLIDAPLQAPMFLDMLRVERTDNIMHKISSVIGSIVGCSLVELYIYDKVKKRMAKYTKGGSEAMNMENLNKVAVHVKNEQYINAAKIDDNQTPEFYDTPTMIVPITNHKTQITIGVVLRGRKGDNPFSPDAERIMRQFSPAVALAVTNSIEFTKVFSDFKKSSEEREGLSALLEVAEILSRQLDIGRLCEIIMEKGRYLTQADRCSLFLVSPDGKSLTTSFHRGLKEGIEIPISKGVVGKTVSDAKPLNIKDAYLDPNFSQETDIATGYKTKSILSVPIFNNRGKVMGVTEMINKKNGQVFTTWDTNLIQIFNVFCGISLENARLYNESLDMSKKLKSFFGISLSLTKSEDNKRIMADIIKNARRALQARRASLFVLDETKQQLKALIVDGTKVPSTLPVSEGIIGACVRTKTAIYSNSPKNDQRFNPKVDEITGFTSLSLCAAPLISTEGQVLGVVEMVNKISGNFSDNDLDLIKAFASFAAISMENSMHKSGIPISNRSARPMWVNDQRPEKFILPEASITQLSTINFSAFDQTDDDLLKMVFTIFVQNGVTIALNCGKDVMLKFLKEVETLYKDVPYHNWRHACDVVQFISYELKEIKNKEIFTPLDIAALFITAICHDVGHEGYTNAFNVKAQTIQGILFKGKSICEMYHCSLLAHTCSNNETNIFGNVQYKDRASLFNIIVDLMLSTDITMSGRIIDEVSIIKENCNNNYADESMRHALLKILLLTANISNVARPFETSMKWCNSLTDEYFKQGDKEQEMKIDFSSPYNDRTQPNKPGLEATFIGMQCIPAFRLLIELFPELDKIYHAVNENMNQWATKNQ